MAVSFIRKSYYGKKPSEDELKPITDRTLNWHFVPVGWNGHAGGIKDHGDDEGGPGWTSLNVIAALKTGEDIRAKKKVPDDIWEAALRRAVPEKAKIILDHKLWKGLMDDCQAAKAERDRAEAQAALEERVAQLGNEKLQTAAPTPQMSVESSEASVDVPDDTDFVDGEALQDVEIEVKDLTTEHMKPVPQWVADNAPGLIGEIYRDIVGRFNEDTPTSIALNTALTMCAVPAALRVTWITNGKKLTPSLYVITLAYTGEGKDPARQYPAHFFEEASAKCMADPRLQIERAQPYARFEAHLNGNVRGPGWSPELPEIDPDDHSLTPDGNSLKPSTGAPNGVTGATPFADDNGGMLATAIDAYQKAMRERQAEMDETQREVKLMPILGLLRSQDVPTGPEAMIEALYGARAKLFTWDEFGKNWGRAMSQPERDWDRVMIENYTRGPVASTLKVDSKEKNIRKYDAHDVAPSMHGFCVPSQLISQIQAHTETVVDGGINRRIFHMDPMKPAKTKEQIAERWVNGANKDDTPPDDLIARFLSLFVGFNDETQIPMPGKVFEKDPNGNEVRNEDGSAKTTYSHAMADLIWPGRRIPKEHLITMGIEGGYELFTRSEVGKLIVEIQDRYDKMRRAFIAKGDNFGANSVVRAAENTWRVACVAAYASMRTEVTYKDVYWGDQYISVSVDNTLGMVGTMIVSERTKDEDRIVELIKEAYDMHHGLVKKKKAAIAVHIGQGDVVGAVARRNLFDRFRSGRENASTRFNLAILNLSRTDVLQEVEIKTSNAAGRGKKCIRAEHLWDASYAMMANGG